LRAVVDSMNRRLVVLRRQFSVPTPGAPPVAQGGGGFGGEQGVRTRIASLKREIMASTSVPTETEMRLAREAKDDLAAAVQDVNGVINTSMPALFRLLADANMATGIKALRPIATPGAPPR